MALELRKSEIVRCLARFWPLHKTEDFCHYLNAIHGCVLDHNVRFRCVYIGEAEFGDLDQNTVGPAIAQWWQVDDDGLKRISRPNFQTGDDRQAFFDTPYMTFFVAGDTIIVTERLGQDIVGTRKGRIHEKGKELEITDVTVIWNHFAP